MDSMRTICGALVLCAALLATEATEAGTIAPPDAALRPAAAEPLGSSQARPPSDVPLGHWSYPFLERLVARGVLDLELSTRPVSRAAVAAAIIKRLEPPASAGGLSERERWALERLEAEFLGGRIDSPALSIRDGDAVLGLGVVLGTGLHHEEGCGGSPAPVDESPDAEADDDCEEICVTADASYELWGGVRDVVGFYGDASFLLEGQKGPQKVKLSNRARTWRGIAASLDRAYVKLERPHASVALGRRGPAWGRSERGRLLVSGGAPTFDQIDASFTLGPVGFHAFHALLEYREIGTEKDLLPGDQAYLAAHRVVFAGSRGSVGLNEVVVYSSGIPDPAYLNPLLPYYLSQHNERANDNILWSLDFAFRPIGGLEIYGECLIDDLQYDRSAANPDKYGLTLGEVYYSHAFGFDYELTVEYSRVTKWTYTHKRVEHRYAHDGRSIGFDLGPDADRVLVDVACHPSPRWSVGVEFERSRKGDGTVTEAFVSDDDKAPAFPSGDARTLNRIALELAYDDLEGFSYGLGAAYTSCSGGEGAAGEDDDGWEVWVGAAFRI